jgi:hypothetical protein
MSKVMNKNTIILTVNNKESSIKKIISCILTNSSLFTSDMIVVLDGCNDKTKKNVKSMIECNTTHIKIEILETPDVWETRANNTGLQSVRTEFATIVQDDMLILDENWDYKLYNVFKRHNVFAVTGRSGHDFSFENNRLVATNVYGREFPLGNNSFHGKVFGKFFALFKPYFIYKKWSPISYAITVNRGPLLLNMAYTKDLGLFDEIFAPFELDDVDLCCRAYKKYGLKSAIRPIYYKELNGSKANNKDSKIISSESFIKNSLIIKERHSDLAN